MHFFLNESDLNTTCMIEDYTNSQNKVIKAENEVFRMKQFAKINQTFEQTCEQGNGLR